MRADRTGDWIQTYKGIQFWPLDPRPEEIDIEDVAHALSMQCRYGGHCREFYSVAQHSVIVSQNVPYKHSLWGLLHDAAEAYLVDLPRPIKRYCEMGRLYKEIENRLLLAVAQRFGLPVFGVDGMPDCVHKADVVVLVTEKRDLMTIAPKPWEDTAEPLPTRIWPMIPRIAERAFLNQFELLTRP